MAREATINVSLTPHQLRLVRERVDSGHYGSASEVIREGLRMLFQQNHLARPTSAGQLQRRLAAGYKATATDDPSTSTAGCKVSSATSDAVL